MNITKYAAEYIRELPYDERQEIIKNRRVNVPDLIPKIYRALFSERVLELINE